MSLADQIRAHIAESMHEFLPPTMQESALLAVVDKCEHMRAESGERGVGRFIADEFEQTIARELGLNS